jgi:hypothetical protein
MKSIHAFVNEERDAGTLPTFGLKLDRYDFEKHADRWLAILDWVLPATCIIALPVGGPNLQYEILASKVQALVRANPTFFRAFIAASEDANFAGLETVQKIREMAMEELAK